MLESLIKLGIGFKAKPSISCKEYSKSISENKIQLIEELSRQLKEIELDLEKHRAELAAALAEGDLRENASYVIAQESITDDNNKYAAISTKLRLLSQEGDKYNSLGLVLVGTTVLLHYIDAGVYSFVVLADESLSDISRGIIDLNSDLGKMLYRRRVGDTIQLSHKIKRKEIEVEVIDLY